MTALKAYQRLEATALWRANPDAQRREVVVSIGDATLTISDINDVALTHWSLAAVDRANPQDLPAIFYPDGDPGETLELDTDGAEMIEAIERVRRAIGKRRPRPGRLRLAMFAGSFLVVAAGAIFWLPDALIRHTVNVVPQVKRVEIGQQLMTRIDRVTGAPCVAPQALPALRMLSQRLTGDPVSLMVLRAGVAQSVHLPGGRILLNRALIEDYEDPNVTAGFVIAERVRAAQEDPLERMLISSGLKATFRLLTTGNMDPDSLSAHAERLLTAPEHSIPNEALLAAFKAAQVPSSPYAYARDVSGETTLPLIEADPFTMPGMGQMPVLSDGNWVRLQGICGG